jgi:N-acyl-D-aspartate/D-glutamate deacylase
MKADLVLFDPDKVGTRATYTNPNHDAEGIPSVAVNGQLVVDERKTTAPSAGGGAAGGGGVLPH